MCVPACVCVRAWMGVRGRGKGGRGPAGNGEAALASATPSTTTSTCVCVYVCERQPWAMGRGVQGGGVRVGLRAARQWGAGEAARKLDLWLDQCLDQWCQNQWLDL